MKSYAVAVAVLVAAAVSYSCSPRHFPPVLRYYNREAKIGIM